VAEWTNVSASSASVRKLISDILLRVLGFCTHMGVR
jgi:hypothetical protein